MPSEKENSRKDQERKSPLSLRDKDPDLNKGSSHPEEPLSEKDFIQNGWSITSFPFWLGLCLVAVASALVLGTHGWYQQIVQKEKGHQPFLEVTNREFSTFLWQFPSYLRVHTKKKTGYLTGFFTDQPNFSAATAEEFVTAPPDLLFLYHTWKRLLVPEFIQRPISPQEFTEFLNQLPEWQPQYWKQAPVGYVKLIESPQEIELVENWQNLPESTLPLIVRLAFQGWKNYFKEGEAINAIQPTVEQMKAFLKAYPNYGRPYWRNIGQVYHQRVAGEQYLLSLLNTQMNGEALIPEQELAPFLKVALFNEKYKE